MLCDRFKKERLKTGLNQVEFAKLFNVTKQTVSNWESGKRKPDIEMLSNIAKYFNVTTDYLLGNDISDNKTDDIKLSNLERLDSNKMVKVPVLGVIKAGIPMFAEENIVDFEYIHQEELSVGEEYFYLEVKGDSMINAQINEGNRVLIRKQDYLECNGDIMAVRVNGDEATLKRIYKQENGIVLQSENPKYAPMFYPASDLENGYVGIIGKAIEVKIKL